MFSYWMIHGFGHPNGPTITSLDNEEWAQQYGKTPNIIVFQAELGVE